MGVNHDGGIINDLKKWIEFNEEVELYDNGLKLRNILHVNDAVYVILKAIELIDNLRPYEIIEVGSRQSETLVDITKLLMKLMDKKIKINLNDRQTEATDVLVDNATATQKLKYIPKTIEEGLIQYLRDCNYGL